MKLIEHMISNSIKEINLGVLSALVVFLLILVSFTFMVPGFVSYGNLINNLLIPAGFAIVISLGMTIIMKGGGIDLSLGSIAGFSAMLGIAVSIVTDISAPLVVLITISAGLLVGGINGTLIGYIGVSPFVATLSITFLIQGMEYFILTGGIFFGEKTGTYLMLPSNLDFLSNRPIYLFAPALIWIFLVYIFLNLSRFGRYITMIGTNLRAADLSGLSPRFYTCMTYVLGGLSAAICGFMLVSREGIVQIGTGEGFLIDAFLLPLFGKAIVGRLSVVGTVLSALILYLIIYGLMAIGAGVFLVNIVKGSLLLIMIIFSQITRDKEWK